MRSRDSMVLIARAKSFSPVDAKNEDPTPINA